MQIVKYQQIIKCQQMSGLSPSLSEVNVSAALEDLLSFWFFCLQAEWVRSENVTGCLTPLHHQLPFLRLVLFSRRLFVCLCVWLFSFYMFHANYTSSCSFICSETLHELFCTEEVFLLLEMIRVFLYSFYILPFSELDCGSYFNLYDSGSSVKNVHLWFLEISVAASTAFVGSVSHSVITLLNRRVQSERS